MTDVAKPEFCYFHSVGVQNIRCFGPAQTLELHGNDGAISKWTVILGDNGVGKTTLLQCLHAVAPLTMDHMPGVLVGTVPASAYWTMWPGRAKRLPFDVLSRNATTPPEVRANVVTNGRLGEPPTAHFRIDVQWSLQGRKFSQATDLNFTMFVCGYGAGRKPGASTLATNEWDSAPTLFDDQATLLGAEEWFLQSDYAAARVGSPAAESRSQKIRETLVDLLPDVDELKVTGLDQQPARPALEAHTPYGWVRVADLSLGYRTLMAWVIDFAARMFARYPDSQNPLAEPAVCLVDEIDLHLHPTWQRKLISFLDERFPNTQFIVTAHSPLVVQAAEQAHVVVLRRHEGDDFVTIHNDIDAVRGWRVDQILTSDLFGLEGSRAPRINDLLHERASILGKPQLDDADRQRLAELDAQLQGLPHGDTEDDQKAWELVRSFANKLRKGASGT